METRKIILFSLVLFSINLYSQTKKGYYVTNNNDTINCLFQSSTLLFSDKLDISVFHGPIRVIENGVKKKYKPLEIKSFTVYDTDDKQYKFGSFADEKRYFVNILIEGCLTLCNLFSAHPYDHSYSPQPAFIKDGKIYRISIFNKKRTIENLISDFPELQEEWIKGKYSKSGLEEIAKDYNVRKCN